MPIIDAIDLRDGSTAASVEWFEATWDGSPQWRVTDLFVEDGHRGQGLGTDLMWAAAQAMVQSESAAALHHILVSWTDSTDRCFKTEHHIYLTLGAHYQDPEHGDGEMVWTLTPDIVIPPRRTRSDRFAFSLRM